MYSRANRFSSRDRSSQSFAAQESVPPPLGARDPERRPRSSSRPRVYLEVDEEDSEIDSRLPRSWLAGNPDRTRTSSALLRHSSRSPGRRPSVNFQDFSGASSTDESVVDRMDALRRLYGTASSSSARNEAARASKKSKGVLGRALSGFSQYFTRGRSDAGTTRTGHTEQRSDRSASSRQSSSRNSVLRMDDDRVPTDHENDEEDYEASAPFFGHISQFAGGFCKYFTDEEENPIDHTLTRAGQMVSDTVQNVTNGVYHIFKDKDGNQIMKRIRNPARFEFSDVLNRKKVGRVTCYSILMLIVINIIIFGGVWLSSVFYRVIPWKMGSNFLVFCSMTSLRMFKFPLITHMAFGLAVVYALSVYDFETFTLTPPHKMRTAMIFNELHRCMKVSYNMSLMTPSYMLTRLKRECIDFNSQSASCDFLKLKTVEIVSKMDFCVLHTLQDENLVHRDAVHYHTFDGESQQRKEHTVTFQAATTNAGLTPYSIAEARNLVLWQRVEEAFWWEDERRSEFVRENLEKIANEWYDQGIDYLIKGTPLLGIPMLYPTVLSAYVMRTCYLKFSSNIYSPEALRHFFGTTASHEQQEGYRAIFDRRTLLDEVIFAPTFNSVNYKGENPYQSPDKINTNVVQIHVQRKLAGKVFVPMATSLGAENLVPQFKHHGECPTVEDLVMAFKSLDIRQCPIIGHFCKEVVGQQYQQTKHEFCPIGCTELVQKMDSMEIIDSCRADLAAHIEKCNANLAAKIEVCNAEKLKQTTDCKYQVEQCQHEMDVLKGEALSRQNAKFDENSVLADLRSKLITSENLCNQKIEHSKLLCDKQLIEKSLECVMNSTRSGSDDSRKNEEKQQSNQQSNQQKNQSGHEDSKEKETDAEIEERLRKDRERREAKPSLWSQIRDLLTYENWRSFCEFMTYVVMVTAPILVVLCCVTSLGKFFKRMLSWLIFGNPATESKSDKDKKKNKKKDDEEEEVVEEEQDKVPPLRSRASQSGKPSSSKVASSKKVSSKSASPSFTRTSSHGQNEEADNNAFDDVLLQAAEKLSDAVKIRRTRGGARPKKSATSAQEGE